MIKSLFIQNYALIQRLEMEPSRHFSTITGETGAGKSIMLGALGLLLGKRADTKVLFDQDEKCVIEGTFDVAGQHFSAIFEENELDYYPESIIRREISPSGKSRAFINDTPVTLEVMKAIGDYLVDIHSQRDTYLLGSTSYQLHIIDGYAGNDEILEDYQKKFSEFREKEKRYNQLVIEAEELKKEADYNHFLFEELDKANLTDGEQSGLEEELKILEHAEEIKSTLFESSQLLDNSEFAINPNIQTIKKNIDKISAYSEHFVPLRDRIESCMLELKDIAREIETEEQKIDFDPARMGQVQERLGLIYKLYQKHSVHSEKELIEIRDELSKKVNKVLNLDNELDIARQSMEKSKEAILTSGDILTASRKNVFDNFSKSLTDILKNLGMPHGSIKLEHQKIKPSGMGLDDIRILFSANAGILPDELKNVASGGEFSRLMFAIKYILAGKTSLPTIIFDEIDTGISGEVSIKLVNMMKEMADRHQVITITHLPQVAAKGDEHYFVYKEYLHDRSISKIKKLTGKEQEEELAKMIGGDNPSAAAYENARDLLKR